MIILPILGLMVTIVYVASHLTCLELGDDVTTSATTTTSIVFHVVIVRRYVVVVGGASQCSHAIAMH